MNPRQERLIDCLAAHGSRTLFQDASGRRLLYSEALELGRHPAFPATRRRLVVSLTDNDLDGLAGYLGLLLADAVPLLLAPNIPADQLRELLHAYRPGYLWLPASRRDEFDHADPVFTQGGYVLLRLGNPDLEIHDDLALLLGTSGSTGSPKFVRLSQGNVLSNARSIADYLGLNGDEVPITTLPPSYTYGLSIIHSHLLVGASIAVTNATFFDRGFWDFLREARATSFGGVPYHYEMLKKLRFTRMDLPHLRTLTQAGGRMEPELTREYAQHCESRGMRFFTMYGQAEATARMSYLPPDKALRKAGSIGIAIPGGRFWLEDETGRVIDRDEAPGELVYQGPNVSLGYAEGYADLARGDERQGVLRTGDLAKRDAEGDYYIVGRLKRFLKLFGRRTNLLDVEKFLLGAGHVVACAGQDDRLEIYVRQATAEQARDIKKRVVEHLQVAVQGVAVYGIGELPRNDSGKIQYAELTPRVGTLLA